MLQKSVLLLLSCILHFFASHSQDCQKFVPVISTQYDVQGRDGFSAGFSAGYHGQTSAFGYAAGVRVEFPGTVAATGEKAEQQLADVFTVYLKGSLRLLRKDNLGSMLFTLAPEMNSASRFDLRSGMQFLLPLSGCLALGLEPGISVRTGKTATSLQLVCKL